MTQSYTKNYRQLIKSGSRRSNPLQGRAHQFIAQCHLVSYETIYTNNIIWTQQFVYKDIYAYANTYKHAVAVSGERGHKFERQQEGIYERVYREEREGRKM